MEARSNIQMTFTCNQDWDAMKVTSCGRFCDVCKKEVIDFTKKPLSKFDHLKGQKFCGRFSDEQLDSSLIKQIQFPFSKTIALCFATLIFAFSSKDSIAKPEKQKIEIIDSKNALAITGVAIAQQDITDQNTLATKHPDKPFLTTKKRKYFWSKRFPFIKSVKANACSARMGNVRYL